jgi:hypothetical protein
MTHSLCHATVTTIRHTGVAISQMKETIRMDLEEYFEPEYDLEYDDDL